MPSSREAIAAKSCGAEIVPLCSVGVEAVAAVADGIRRWVNGDTVSYVVNRISITPTCYFGCKFCAFSKGKRTKNSAANPTISRWTRSFAERKSVDLGATEFACKAVFIRIIETYLEILRAIKSVLPELHVHAFTPLEVFQGAKTLDLPLDTFLGMLRDEGLGTLPGTAAEILDDEVRATLCPDKINTDQWLEVMETAHGVARHSHNIVRSHPTPKNWARHSPSRTTEPDRWLLGVVPLPSTRGRRYA